MGQVSPRYGPLMYTAESVDQDITGKRSGDSALTAEWKGDLPGGVMVIEGAWADDKALLAIPYYARNNRTAESPKGRNRNSSVWMKDQ